MNAESGPDGRERLQAIRELNAYQRSFDGMTERTAMVTVPSDSVERNPRRSGFYTPLSGPINRWWFVFGCALVNMFASGIFLLYAMNVFFVGANAEYGWPKSTASTLLAVFSLSAGPGFLALGWAMGRYGIRRPSLLFALGYACTVLIIPYLPPIRSLFMINFLLMGFLGASACAMPFAIAITASFDRNRGLALGLGAAGAGFGSAVTASLSNLLLEHFGWRSGLSIYSVLAVAVILLSLTFLVRTPPETITTRSAAEADRTGDPSFRALVDREMVIIVAVLFLNALCAVGVIGSLVPLLGGRGISTATAAWLLSVVGLSSWGGRVLVGWLLDRLFAPHVACGTFILGVIGALLLVYTDTLMLACFGGVMIGICMGAEQDLAMYLVSRYFPASVYSKAVSISWLAWAWGGGAGSFIAAESYNFTHDYQVALWAFVMLFIVAAVMVLQLPPYRIRSRHEVEPG